MGFDIEKFSNSQFVPREESMLLPDLQEFFDEGEKPEFVVRGLTGHELARANEAVDKNKTLSAMVEGLLSSNQKEKTEAIRSMVGLSDKNTPDEIIRRIQHLIVGSVNPKFNQPEAVKLCKVFPIEFYQLTNKISQLTGQGHVVGKPRPSGETPA